MIFGWILLSLIYGAIDCDVIPEKAGVYIDGKYLGVADDFDGWPRYLYIQAGKYEISFKMDGYEDLNMSIEVQPNKVLRIKEKMKRIPPSQYREEKREEIQRRGKGQIYLKVFPEEAVVYLNGKFWLTVEEISRLHSPLQIDEGKHIIEVICPGFKNFKKEVEIRSGEFLELNIVLNKVEGSLEN